MKVSKPTQTSFLGLQRHRHVLLALMSLSAILSLAFATFYNRLPSTLVLPTERSMQNLINRKERNRVLVHVAKTGGMTIRDYARWWIDYEVHGGHRYNYGTLLPLITIDEFHPKDSDILYVAVRDPIKRTLSAWKFREYLIDNNYQRRKNCSVCPEKKCFTRYGSFSKFAESLYTDPIAPKILENPCIGLVEHNFTKVITPIKDFIEEHPQQVYIIRTEHINEDMLKVFGIKPPAVTHQGPSGGGESYLSQKAVANLNKFLSQEYEIYYWLLCLKGLDP